MGSSVATLTRLVFDVLFWLLACTSSPAPDDHGRVLWAGEHTLLVQHDDLKGRVVAGVERYRTDGTSWPTGDASLWFEEDGSVRNVEKAGDIAKAQPAHPLKGTVINIDGSRVMVDHEPIPGVMGAMVMGFGLAPWELEALQPGHRIEAQIVSSDYGWQLVDVAIKGKVEAATRTDVKPLQPGQVLPKQALTAEDGSTLYVGEGQGRPTALTYIYTRCPDPSFCPAIAARMAALQTHLDRARILTVSIDPEFDTPERLAAWGSMMGADPKIWRQARAEPAVLQDLALRGGQHVTADNGRISHLHRLLILDANGALIERYDDNRWPLERVVKQLEESE